MLLAHLYSSGLIKMLPSFYYSILFWFLFPLSVVLVIINFGSLLTKLIEDCFFCSLFYCISTLSPNYIHLTMVSYWECSHLIETNINEYTNEYLISLGIENVCSNFLPPWFTGKFDFFSFVYLRFWFVGHLYQHFSICVTLLCMYIYLK